MKTKRQERENNRLCHKLKIDIAITAIGFLNTFPIHLTASITDSALSRCNVFQAEYNRLRQRVKTSTHAAPHKQTEGIPSMEILVL